MVLDLNHQVLIHLACCYCLHPPDQLMLKHKSVTEITDRRNRRKNQEKISYLNFMYGNETTDESSVTYIQIDRLLNQTVIKAGILSEPRTHKSPTLEYLVLFYIFLVMSILMKHNEPGIETPTTQESNGKNQF
ncbi:hypothetical protein OUZ56_016801 [Daphnia magna]|uniref:Uncharacterized protein n=1 Tax=Daphnia magna TaxID=35525 RepID=A0ABR0ARM2_9CRUS|nr:hypothetical protein OUZ56_016801 [Daphnia magna]